MRSEGIPRPVLVLTRIQAILAAAALAVDLADSCGSCRVGGGVRLWVAGAGVLGYGTLLVLGCLERGRILYYAGLFAAVGVHTALGLVMLLEGQLCPICAASALVSFGLGAWCVLRADVPISRVAWTSLPTFATALALVLPHAAVERDPDVIGHRDPDGGSVFRLQLDVYELAHCSYCEKFRESYLPRLKRAFGEALEVRFHDASRVRGIQRTPTFILDGRPLFEGLPYRYEDLEHAIRETAELREV